MLASGAMANNESIIFNPNGTITLPIDGSAGLFIPTDGLTGLNRDNNTGYGNITLFIDPELCNLSVCDLTLAHFDYIPNLAGNALYTAIFGLYIFANIYLGFRHRTWGYMAAMFLGLTGEVVGYIGRILLWQNPFDPTGNDFLIYLVSLTIAPAFFSAAVYLCLARIVVVYGQHLSFFKPRTYTLIFCGCDLFSLVLQALGGGITSNASTYAKEQQGIHIILAGLSTQVASLALFAVLCAEFALRLRRNPTAWSTEHAALYNSRLFKAFLCGLSLATLCIFVRSVFRVAELSGGFHGPLANNEVSFMILEGAMLVIATSCLTFLHPGVAFQGFWQDANFSFRTRKGDLEKSPVSTREESLQQGD